MFLGLRPAALFAAERNARWAQFFDLAPVGHRSSEGPLDWIERAVQRTTSDAKGVTKGVTAQLRDRKTPCDTGR